MLQYDGVQFCKNNQISNFNEIWKLALAMFEMLMCRKWNYSTVWVSWDQIVCKVMLLWRKLKQISKKIQKDYCWFCGILSIWIFAYHTNNEDLDGFISTFAKNCFVCVFFTPFYFGLRLLPTSNSCFVVKGRNVKKLRYQFSCLAGLKNLVLKNFTEMLVLCMILLAAFSFCLSAASAAMFCPKKKEPEKGVIVSCTINSSLFKLVMIFFFMLRWNQNKCK